METSQRESWEMVLGKLMQFLANKPIFLEEGGNGNGPNILGFDPENIVTILQVKIPFPILVHQLI
jgi:hypothetical protein